MKTLTIKEIQKYQLDLLKRLLVFFDENDIHYYLAYGSMIGAVRHNGFIPWDDDIDILILRDDYDRLIKLDVPSELNFEIASLEKKTLPLPFAKAIDKNIKIITDSIFDEYLWIDLFPIDNLPESDKKCKSLFKRTDFFKSILGIRLMKKNCISKNYSGYKRMVARIIKPFIDLFDPYFYANQVKNANKYRNIDTGYYGNYVWAFYCVKFSKKMIDEIDYYTFEDLKVKSFKDYDRYLTDTYGDYMVLPPVEKRISHNMEAIIYNEK